VSAFDETFRQFGKIHRRTHMLRGIKPTA
jgi:hypothetical protein